MWRQHTISREVSISGVGLHSGARVRLRLSPAPTDDGITFRRSDIPRHPRLQGTIDNLAGTELATTLGAGVNGSRATVMTVEHLLAATMCLGVDNLEIHLDGPEVPILDGSADGFVSLLKRAGRRAQMAARRLLVVRRTVKVVEGDKVARLSPPAEDELARVLTGDDGALEICSALEYNHPSISSTPICFRQTWSNLNEGCWQSGDGSCSTEFECELGPARTFGFLRDVEALQQKGLCRGGSLDNALVLDDNGVVNPDGLRFPNECERHKVLDALGDLALCGMPVCGRLVLNRSGHAMNTKLVAALLRDPANYDIVAHTNVRSSVESSAHPA